MLLRRLHLCLALAFGLVFAMSGLTGSLLVWIHEIDALLNPELFHVAPPSASASAPSPARVQEIVDSLSRQPGYGRPTQISIPARPDESVTAWYRPQRPAQTALLEIDVSRQVMVDPHTLAILGERRWGESGFSRQQIMPTLFHLHRYFLAGEAGKIVIGVSGLALLLVAVLGVILWWPRMTLQALRKSLTVAYRGSWPRFNYTSHRAVGFFAAPLLAMLGFSGLYFNLPEWVVPVVHVVAPVTKAGKLQNQGAPGGEPITVETALLSAQRQFPDGRLSRIALPPNLKAPYEIRLRQPGEVRQGDGNTRISIDALNGQVLRVRDPLQARTGDTILNWQFPLHTGEAFGLVGRIVIALTGLTPLAFLITGVAVWLNRRPRAKDVPVFATVQAKGARYS